MEFRTNDDVSFASVPCIKRREESASRSSLIKDEVRPERDSRGELIYFRDEKKSFEAARIGL